MLLDAAVSLAGLIVPPAFDFIKKKFIKSEADTPERTIGTLATTKPETLPEYIKALGEWTTAKVGWFNRDVVGDVSPWVRNLRAAIRPVTVVAGLGIFTFNSVAPWLIEGASRIPLDPSVKYTLEACISSWFGSRLQKQ